MNKFNFLQRTVLIAYSTVKANVANKNVSLQNLILIFAVVLEKLKYGTINAVFIWGLILLPVALLETTSR